MSSSLADTVVYQYDDLNRLIRIEYSDGAVIEYTYNAAGNRLSGQMSPPPDNISPIVTITSPNGGIDTTIAQSLVTISGITSDTGRGVATVSINTGQENTGDTANFSFLVELEPDTNIFIVTATDNAGNTGTDTIAIIYNAAPILSPIGDQIVDEGDTLTFAITASDSNSQDLLTYSVSNLPQGASFDTSTQVFTWVTDYDDSGIYANIVFTVNDGRGSSDSETISITVNNVNRPPVLAPIGDKSVNEGDTLTFEITASDSDTEDTISYTAQPLPDGASFGNPTFTWTPGYDQAGTYPVTFIATDTQGDSDSETIIITVNNVNQPPVLDLIADITVNEAQTITIIPTASDPDGDSLAFSYSGWMSADTYTTTYDDAGTYTVMVTVSDGELSDSQAVTITVNNVNRCPILAEIGNRSVNEGNLLTIDLTCSDSDNDPLVFSIEGLPAGATFIDNGDTTATFGWTPGYGNSGNYGLTFKVSDGVCTDQEDIIISVGDVNRPPVLDPIANITVNEGQTITITPTASDPDGDSLTFSYSGWMSADTYTTTYNDAGTYTVIVTVSDGELSDSQAVTITVNNINRCPILAEIENKTVNEGQMLTFSVTASDSDNDPLVFSPGALPEGANFIDHGDGTATFNWTPGYADSGTYTVTFNISDRACTNQETITITVNNINRPPLLDPISHRTVSEGELLQFALTAADPDGESLTYSAANLPPGAAFDSASQTFNWLPDFSQAGIYQGVLFTVTDSGIPTLSDSETITITVATVNRCPVLARIGNKTVDEGRLLTFGLSGSDSDGEDALSLSHSGLPSGATFVNQTFGWTPGYDRAGTYSLTFYVSDGRCSDSETINITVNNTNLCPILSQIGDISIREGDTLTLSITVSDSDQDTINCSATGLPQGAVFENCLLTWGTDYADSGSYEVTVEVSDGICGDSEVITVTVGNVNQPPVIDPIAGITVNEGGAVTIIPTASDPDGDTLTFTYSGWMTTATYITNYDDAGTHPVIVTISDGQLSDSCEVTITVADVLSTNITRPTQGGRLSGNAVIIEASTQAEGITGIDFYRKFSDSDTWTMIGSGIVQSSTYRAYWNADNLEDGGYSLKAVTKSDKGNLDQSPPEITVTIDHQSPDYVEGWAKKGEWSTIGNEGGPRVEIPAGALDDDTILRILEPDQAELPPPNDNPTGIYIKIELESGQTQLNNPVTISMPYPDDDDNGTVDDTDILEENLKVNLYNGNAWEELPTTVDSLNNIATATTDHFTIFGLFGTLKDNLDDILVYPNPFKPGKGDAALKFLNLTPDATIRIYNVAGELVSIKENITTGAACWDGRNDHGKPVASGGYFYIVTDNEGRKKTGKIAVIW